MVLCSSYSSFCLTTSSFLTTWNWARPDRASCLCTSFWTRGNFSTIHIPIDSSYLQALLFIYLFKYGLMLISYFDYWIIVYCALSCLQWTAAKLPNHLAYNTTATSQASQQQIVRILTSTKLPHNLYIRSRSSSPRLLSDYHPRCLPNCDPSDISC